MPRTWPRGFLHCAVAVIMVLAWLAVMGTRPAHAATTTIVSDEPSCTAFGGRWDANQRSCQVNSTITVAAGDTLVFQVNAALGTIVNNGTFTVSGRAFVATGAITNNVGATINGSGSVLRTYGASTNYGTINGSFEIARPFTNASTGQMNMSGLLFLAAVLTNNGTITLKCGGRIEAIYDGTVAGNPTKDGCPPSVTVNQAAGQADPANTQPVLFTASFSEPVTGFANTDVTLAGTANLSGASVAVSGGPSTFTISVAGLGGSGTVTASVAANAATDAGGNASTASTSSDNSVTFVTDSTPPVIDPVVAGTAGTNGWYVGDVTVGWNVTDAQSPISGRVGCDAQTVTRDDAGITFTCSATSTGGLASRSVTVKRDATAPALAPSVSPDPSSLNAAVSASPNATDATSGVASASCDAPDTSSAGSKRVVCTATDKAGNTATASAAYTVSNPAPIVAPGTPIVAPAPIVAPGTAAKPPAPLLSSLRVTSRRFRAATSGGSIARAGRAGTRLSYQDTLAAVTRFTVYRKRTGVLRGGTCVAPSRASDRGKPRRCTRLLGPIGGFTHQDRAGANQLRFTGRLHGATLAPGRYLLKATATLGGQTSAPVTASFDVLPAKRR